MNQVIKALAVERLYRSLVGLFITVFLVAGGLSGASVAHGQSEVSFENQIKPFINTYCMECHQGEDAESFRMDNEEMFDYIISGDAENSDLFARMTLEEDDDAVMPPIDHSPRPSAAEIMLVKTWIEQGAKVNGETIAAPVDDADVSPFEKHIYNAIGSLHPAAVHLPLGLLLAAGLFAFLSLRGNFVMSDCAYYCLWLGMWGGIIACVSGWWFSPMQHRGTVVDIQDLFDPNHKVLWHRNSAIVLTILTFFVCIVAKWTRHTNPDEGTLWKLGAIAIAAGVGWVGHLGGELTYGKNHFKDLEAIVDIMMEPAEVEADDDSSEEMPDGESDDGESDDVESDDVDSDEPLDI